MAIFNPELQSQPGFVSPARQVDIPNPPTPVPRMDTAPAIFQTLSNFATGFIEAGKRQGGGVGSQADQFRGQFVEGLEIVESIREKQGLTAARLAEQKLASNFAGAGINLGEYKDTYETVTGRSFDQYGQDVGASMLDEAMKDQNVQANFLAASVALGPQSTSEERLSWAMQETSLQNAYAIEVGRSRREGAKAWGTRGEAAYVGILDGFLNQSVGQMVALQENGGRINPAQVSQLRVAWDAMKVELTAPQGVDADMFKPVGDKIAAIDTFVSTLEKASSSDQILNELSFAIGEAILQEGGGSFESVLAAASAFKDPLGAAEMGGFNWRENLMKLSGKTILKVDGVALDGEITEQGGTETILKELPSSLKTQVEGLSPGQHLKDLEAGGMLTTMVAPNRMQLPEAQNQFGENTILMGATLMEMGSNEFLSPTMLKKLVGNPTFLTNLETLVTTNPELGNNSKTILKSGLTRELVRQENNLGSIETVAGVRWDGRQYVLDQQALMARGMTAEQAVGFIGWVGRNFGGDLTNLANNTTVPLPPGMSYSPGDLKLLYQRRESIGILRDTLGKLGVSLAPEEVTPTPEPTALGPVTLPKDVAEDTEFVRSVNDTASYLSISPDSLFRVIGFETAGTFSPSVQPIRKDGTKISSATGLIQFLESTAKGLGTTTKELAGMTRSQQMEYVRRYLEPFRGRMKNDGDVYMAVHWPAAVGKDDTYVMYRSGTDEYSANSGLDTNDDGIVTRGETLARVFSGAASSGNFPGATAAPAAGPVTTEQVRSGEALPTPEMLAGGAGGATAPVEVSTASGGEVAVSVADGGAPVSGGTQGGAPLLDQAVAGQQGQTQEGEGGANAAAPIVSAEVQAFIEDLAANPDRTFSTDEEFLVAQERGELEPGDAVVVNGVVYVISKDGTPRRVGAVGS